MNQKAQKFGWWIEILTNEVNKQIHIYYFEVFESFYQAETQKEQYIQYLTQKHSEIIDIQIEQCQPKELTVYLSFFPICLWRFCSKQPSKLLDNRLRGRTSEDPVGECDSLLVRASTD